jgi:hypothetical protein
MARAEGRAPWIIEEYDGTEVIARIEAPGTLSVTTVGILLQRLLCRHLDAEQILGSTLRRNSVGREGILEPTVERSPQGVVSVTVGANVRYQARQRKLSAV